MLVQKLCKEEEVGFVEKLCWEGWRADIYMRDRLHLSGNEQQYLRMK